MLEAEFEDRSVLNWLKLGFGNKATRQGFKSHQQEILNYVFVAN